MRNRLSTCSLSTVTRRTTASASSATVAVLLPTRRLSLLCHSNSTLSTLQRTQSQFGSLGCWNHIHSLSNSLQRRDFCGSNEVTKKKKGKKQKKTAVSLDEDASEPTLSSSESGKALKKGKTSENDDSTEQSKLDRAPEIRDEDLPLLVRLLKDLKERGFHMYDLKWKIISIITFFVGSRLYWKYMSETGEKKREKESLQQMSEEKAEALRVLGDSIHSDLLISEKTGVIGYIYAVLLGPSSLGARFHKFLNSTYPDIRLNEDLKIIHLIADVPALFPFLVVISRLPWSNLDRLSGGVINTTPLLVAAARGNVTAVRWLVKRKDVNKDYVNGFGVTALMNAAVRGHIETVRVLLEAGCDHTITDRKGRTALELAWMKGYSDVTDLLASMPLNSEPEESTLE